jgi:GH24 family phage-related lysozyme (muramidase)
LKNLKKIDNIVIPTLSTVDSSVFKLRKPLFENIPGVDIVNAKTSLSTKNFIKEHEKLRLEAYDIGDGHTTIGYGHAEPTKTSKYKVGDKITEKTAERLFAEDIKRAEDGVKRMLKKWELEKVNVKITQSMFDAMVSMAFNMGVQGFLTCDFIDDLKKGDYETAAEKIKTTRINGKVKNDKNEWVLVEMPGLKGRRLTEFELFSKDIT